MRQPEITIPSTIKVPAAERLIARNGTSLYAIKCPEYKVVRISFVFEAGSTRQQHPFIASATANMLAEGSQNLSAQQIAERLDYYGSYFDINIDRDHAYITFCTLSKFFSQTAEIIEEVILRPTFPQEETATYCAKRKQQLTIERRKVEHIARENFAKAMFGAEHPYGISADEALYDNVRREDLIALYNELYTANNCFVVCSGRIDEQVIEALGKLIEELPASESRTVEFGAPVSTPTLHRDIASALQSSIRIGRLLFPRTHPDFVGMQVVAAALGGYFGSRLMYNLREQHGYTYGVMAAMVNFEREGYLAIATQVAREHRNDALREIYHEIERLREEPLPDDELQMVKNVMIGEILRILDGPFGIADVTIENIMCGMDNRAMEQSVERILSITAEQIRELAERYLRREDLVEVVVG